MKYGIGDVIITRHSGMCIYIGKFSKLTFSVNGKIKLIAYNCYVYIPLKDIEESDNFLFDMPKAFEKKLIEIYFNNESIHKVAVKSRKYATEVLYSTHNSLICEAKEFKSVYQGKKVSVYYRK